MEILCRKEQLTGRRVGIHDPNSKEISPPKIEVHDRGNKVLLIFHNYSPKAKLILLNNPCETKSGGLFNNFN